jgi:hypothetical protein
MRHGARRQSGESLVSLMVGLLVSMLVALAMVSMFKVSNRFTSQAGQDAAADAQVTSALLRAGIATQDAGFGLADAAFGVQLKVLADAALAGSTLSGSAVANGSSGNAVLWAMQTGANPQCAGLLYQDASNGTGGLYYLGPVACSSGNVSGWSALAWTSTPWVERPASQASAAYNQTKISFSAVSSACKPFGLTANSGKLLITIASTNRSGAAITEQQCLFNFKA